MDRFLSRGPRICARGGALGGSSVLSVRSDHGNVPCPLNHPQCSL